MKKIISLLLCIISFVILFGCAKNSDNGSSQQKNGVNQNQAQSQEQAQNQTTLVAGVNTNKVTSDTLVCYFSCTGSTAQIASYIVNITGGDLFEIMPKQPYIIDDLDYSDPSSRSNIEHNDANSRPEISSKITSWSSYKTVYVGYPIWYNEAPKIIYTFFDTYDCTGKTVIPFCTSKSDDISNSTTALKKVYSKLSLQSGISFGSLDTEEQVAKTLKKKQ